MWSRQACWGSAWSSRIAIATASHSWATSATPMLSAQPGVGAPTMVQASTSFATRGMISEIRSIGCDLASRSGSRPSIRVGNGLPVRLIRAGRLVLPRSHLGQIVLGGGPEQLLGRVENGGPLQVGIEVVDGHPAGTHPVGLLGQGPGDIGLLGERVDHDLLAGLDVDAHPDHQARVLLQQDVERLRHGHSLSRASTRVARAVPPRRRASAPPGRRRPASWSTDSVSVSVLPATMAPPSTTGSSRTAPTASAATCGGATLGTESSRP